MQKKRRMIAQTGQGAVRTRKWNAIAGLPTLVNDAFYVTRFRVGIKRGEGNRAIEAQNPLGARLRASVCGIAQGGADIPRRPASR
jgi:hypothetical protein